MNLWLLGIRNKISNHFTITSEITFWLIVEWECRHLRVCACVCVCVCISYTWFGLVWNTEVILTFLNWFPLIYFLWVWFIFQLFGLIACFLSLSPNRFYFYFFLILFYYLTLQYCIGFAIYQHESTTGIHVFPILNPPPSCLPSGSSQCTSPKHPVSCLETGLVTHFIYDIIHVSMPFSQIIPPIPLPQSPKDCSIHQRFFCCLTINCGKFWKKWGYQTTWSASWEICMQVRKQQLELDMEQQTGFK